MACAILKPIFVPKNVVDSIYSFEKMYQGTDDSLEKVYNILVFSLEKV